MFPPEFVDVRTEDTKPLRDEGVTSEGGRGWLGGGHTRQEDVGDTSTWCKGALLLTLIDFIRKRIKGYCRVLGGGVFLWARYRGTCAVQFSFHSANKSDPLYG